MSIKNIEEQVLNSLFDCKKYKDKESKRIIKYLKSIRNTKEDSESPDFLFTDGDKVIGVEHFLVDTLRLPENEKVSVSRDIKKNIPKLLEKYNYGESFKENPESMVDALNDAGKEVTKFANSSNNFDNSLFIKEFRRIAFDHKGKVSNYIGKIKKNKYVDDKDISLYFLIEIRYRKQVWNVIDRDGKLHRQAINGIPFTFDFIKALKKLTNVDYVILYFADGIIQSKDNFIYAFNTKDIDKSLTENKISIFQDFKSGYNGEKTRITKVEQNNGKLDITFESNNYFRK